MLSFSQTCRFRRRPAAIPGRGCRPRVRPSPVQSRELTYALLCSRQSLKKYILANNKITLSEAAFNSQFNKAIKTGVEKGEFTQPKGKSLQMSSLALRVDLAISIAMVYVVFTFTSLTRHRTLGPSETREEGCGQARRQGMQDGEYSTL